MKTAVRLVLICVLMIVATPAYTAEVVHMWMCEVDDDATEAQIEAGAQKWLAAAKQVPGGENIEAAVLWPIAVNATGEFDLTFAVTVPTMEEWGRFWDNYAGSEAAAVEVENEEFVVCPDSVIWELTKVGG